jgi:hypothetical protein
MARDGPQITPPSLAAIEPFLEPKSPELRNSRNRPASRVKSKPKTDKLNVTKTRQAGQECWTIKTGKRGEKKADFRVRLADSGFRVVLSFYDTNGARKERYCCYLSADEWRDAKRKSLATFARLIAGKVDARHGSGDLDAGRYQEIAPRLAALT